MTTSWRTKDVPLPGRDATSEFERDFIRQFRPLPPPMTGIH
jgi:hypothetical protein